MKVEDFVTETSVWGGIPWSTESLCMAVLMALAGKVPFWSVSKVENAVMASTSNSLLFPYCPSVVPSKAEMATGSRSSPSPRPSRMSRNTIPNLSLEIPSPPFPNSLNICKIREKASEIHKTHQASKKLHTVSASNSSLFSTAPNWAWEKFLFLDHLSLDQHLCFDNLVRGGGGGGGGVISPTSV